jgi:SEL1 protein
MYWTRLSKQLNRDAQVKAGDYYLAGLGTQRDPEKAATCYIAAADQLHSGMAQWNLGWMHENGVGVEQDYYLAKRYYDLSLYSAPDGYLPVKLALIQLYVKSWWNRISGGKIRSIKPENTPDIGVLWKQFWRKWSELDYKYWLVDDGDEVEPGAPAEDDLPFEAFEASQDDIIDALMILGCMALFAVVMWYRHRQQVRFGRPVVRPPFMGGGGDAVVAVENVAPQIVNNEDQNHDEDVAANVAEDENWLDDEEQRVDQGGP